MFQRHTKRGRVARVFSLLSLTYHATVRNVRTGSGNAILGLLSNMAQAVILVAVFYAMFSILGLRGAPVRGDFIVYLMSGVFLFLTHNKALSAVLGAEGPTSPMMKHAPMNTLVSISSAALAALYLQLLAFGVILIGVHVAWRPVEIHDPVGLMRNFMLAWASGAAIGLVFLALKPWAPGLVQLVSMVYMRANMISSGKMFVVNQLPGYLLPYFTWNPLFHTIDQARGAAFVNYFPRHTTETYPAILTVTCLMLGLMGEFYTRRRASASWSARQ